ncbi:MAG: UDP binding domain-containing protein [Rhodopseudomonas palustris]|nr:UDP binding domain-containing protein [Rhodopseudomonas palustris]
MGAQVRAYDPAGMEQARRASCPISIIATIAYSCAQDADALVIVTEWVQFRALDLAKLKDVLRQPVVVDLRNIYRPEQMAAHGFIYESIGRGAVND